MTSRPEAAALSLAATLFVAVPMAAPQVANLAAKMLAVNPALTPPQLVAIIRDTSERTADGRRALVNPRKAVAAAEAARG